ncbi:MAG TPA: aminoglycoside phosphotransferase family protein [Candidatus Saccharimonadales bacterium]|nr:aminoglycoside phosphotransferase family protein [Candidatus Saccharimonadales bacterium]
MNPDTKLTDEQIKEICQRHDITYRYHERITTGFSHEVHRLNDDLVIKLYNTDDSQRFTTESAMLALDAPIKKPRLIAKGRSDESIDRDYVIMSYVPGFSLGGRWHLASDSQREALISDISQSLQAINKVDQQTVSLQAQQSWEQYIAKRSSSLVESLLKKETIDPAIADKVQAFFDDNLHIFAGEKLYPVYWDIHFDNFIVDENFKLQALIDLENVELTALDYPLVVIQKQIDEPEKYLSEADERYADKADYAKLRGWYEKYYPEIFTSEHLETRLKAYLLLDTLHLLVNWSHVKSLHEKLKTLL